MSHPRRAFDGVFDRSGRVPLPQWRDRRAEVFALLRDLSPRLGGRLPLAPDLPRGDGHPVLVIPGLFSSDYLTRGFRGVLAELGYEVIGWGGGVNLGPTQRVWGITEGRLLGMADRTVRRVTLIGHSLGGIIARALAFEHPARVRQVITVCSPFRLPIASRMEPMYRLLGRAHIDEDILLSRIAEPPPVPTVAIYTPRDGIVAWGSCLDLPTPGRENIAIEGAHSTMLSNPKAIRVIAERLARPVPRCSSGIPVRPAD
jgi:hypothetical protein